MLNRLPEFIDPWRLAAGNQRLEGCIPVQRFTRVVSLLAGTEGNIALDLEFSRGPRRRPLIHGHIQAELLMQCQRCMEIFLQPLESDVNLLVVEPDDEVATLPENSDILLVEDKRCKLQDLVEDELLLAIPLIAMHAPEDCSRSLDYSVQEAREVESETDNPFAVLAGLVRTEKDSGES